MSRQPSREGAGVPFTSQRPSPFPVTSVPAGASVDSSVTAACRVRHRGSSRISYITAQVRPSSRPRSEEHTSELQSRQYLGCRLLLDKNNDRSEEHTCQVEPPH